MNNDPLPPVEGDELPAIGSTVLIHLGRQNEWVTHTVVGYYAWGDLGGNDSLHRLFVRVRDAEGYLNARLLKDIRPVPAIAPCLHTRSTWTADMSSGACTDCGAALGEATQAPSGLPTGRKVPARANGGKARAAKLSPERRREIASSGGIARRKKA